MSMLLQHGLIRTLQIIITIIIVIIISRLTPTGVQPVITTPCRPNRCGEDVVLRKRCEVDITQFMKYQCEGHPVCEVMVDVATFNAEFCPDVKKYAEVVFDCVPVATLDRVRRCNDKCLSLAAPPHPFGSK